MRHLAASKDWGISRRWNCAKVFFKSGGTSEDFGKFDLYM